MGVRPKSPLTALDEVTVAVTRLLAGENVSMDGKTVFLDNVQLAAPPADVPPILLGIRGPKSLALPDRVAGGIGLASPSYVRTAVEQAGAPEGFAVAAFSAFPASEVEHSLPQLEHVVALTNR